MKHKHSEIIKAFADGIECEYWSSDFNKWVDINVLTTFNLDWVEIVRIKPEPQYQEPQFFHVYNDMNTAKTYMSPTLIRETCGWVYLGKVRVEK